MQERPSYRAGTFYPASRTDVDRAIEEMLRPERRHPEPQRVLGGVVPHAGWVYSGGVAFGLFERLATAPPERVVLLGAVHVPGVPRPAVGPWARWRIPGGAVEVDVELQELLVEHGAAEWNRRAHQGEHSIEVQLPLLARTLPGVRILPVAVPAGDSALELGRILGELLTERASPSAVVASSDLTHYGPDYYGFAPVGVGPDAVRWARENDLAFLERVLALDAPGALREARTHKNACGAGAAAAAIVAAARLGATRGELLEHTSSLAVHGEQEARNFVGYAAVAFV